jgi:hypothetical protein
VIIGIDPSLSSTGVSDGTRHISIKTKPDNADSQEVDLIRRCVYITHKIADFLNDGRHRPEDPITVVIEAPSLNGKQGSSHLYEVGFLMSSLHRMFDGPNHTIIQVAPTSLRLAYADNGAAGKKHKDPPDKPNHEPCMDCVTKNVYGMEFESDAGRDKRDAYALYKYGEAVVNRTIEHKPSKRRGQAAKEKRDRKKQRESKRAAKRDESSTCGTERERQ